ncbi:MAG TPA: penicillin-binding protein 2, partial [Gammaproteobacteria bacterium]|nr:penicillin-binding protein 2 [Gammaproteobacteria bacterium]
NFIEAPKAGQDIHLSIDKRLQYIAYRELKKAVAHHKAKSASLVILDTRTGEVLAMVNQPAFNPNNYSQTEKHKRRNLTVTDLFEPGSTIKPFIVAAALKTKQFTSHTPVNTSPGYMRVGRATIRDVRNYGELDLTGVIKKSSNVGIVKISLSMDKEYLWESLSDFGFGEMTESHFPGERRGYLPFFGEWKKLTQATVSFGYGISCTPLQLAQSYALFANKGYLKPVSMYRLDEAPEGKAVLSEDVSQAVLAMMETVVSREGTARAAAIPGYRVAGKTGTMKKLGAEGYLDHKYLSVFAGIVPVSQPRLVGVVLFDEPSNKEYYGGKVAAPVFSVVMSEALRLLAIAPDKALTPGVRVASLGSKSR